MRWRAGYATEAGEAGRKNFMFLADALPGLGWFRGWYCMDKSPLKTGVVTEYAGMKWDITYYLTDKFH